MGARKGGAIKRIKQENLQRRSEGGTERSLRVHVRQGSKEVEEARQGGKVRLG